MHMNNNNEIISITSNRNPIPRRTLENTNPYSSVQQHLNQALKLMSDRQNPDYRNSIKSTIFERLDSLRNLFVNDCHQ